MNRICGVAQWAFLMATGLGMGMSVAEAAEGVSRAQLVSGETAVTWTGGSNLQIEYKGRPVFKPNASGLVLHDSGWTGHYYDNRAGTAVGQLAEANGSQTLVIRHPTKGFACTQTVTVGPGDRVSMEFRYRQDQWDDAGLQLGFGKPDEGFWAGSAFVAEGASGRASGTIPLVFAPVTKHPFRAADRVILRSPFGTLRLTASRPVTLHDYEQRHGTFWLGLDEPLPRGEERVFRVEMALTPAQFEVGGLVLGDLSVTERVADGLLRAGLRLARTANGPTQVILKVEVRRDGEASLVESVSIECAEAPQLTHVSVPVLKPGPCRVVLSIHDAATRGVIWQTSALQATVVPALTVRPRFSLFTKDDKPALLVWVNPRVGDSAGPRVVIEGPGFRTDGKTTPGATVELPIDLSALSDGETLLSARLVSGGRTLGEATTTVRKAAPKANSVIIDYATRGLIVDGLPMFPFGFYCFDPPDEVAAQEAPMGFTHVAPYRRSTFADGESKQTEMLASLDRCAAVGIKVHYDLRKIATRKDTPETWALLKREVEAVRDHPALLGYYLADEPAIGQHQFPPARMEKAYRFIKELDPYHPCSIVFVNLAKAPAYANATDIVMHDPYPIPNHPVTMVAERTRQTREAFGDGVPLWIVPQAFGGGEAWRREPTAAEERVMTYLALINGANGIQYFMRVLPRVRPMTPQTWHACRDLAAQVQELAPFLLSPLPRPKVRCNRPEVAVAAWTTDDAILILTANAEKRPTSFAIGLTGATHSEVELPFEGRSVALRDGQIEDIIDGFGTRAYIVALRDGKAEPGVEADNLTHNPSFELSASPGIPDGYYIQDQQDPGAHVRTDPRLSRHGRHSLRVVTSVDDGGIRLWPFPMQVTKDQTCRISFWARSLAPGEVVELKTPVLDRAGTTFELTAGWAEYSFTGKAKETGRRGQFYYRLKTAGTVWFDLVQMVPVR